MYKENEEKLRALFTFCRSPEDIYKTLLDLGRGQKQLEACFKTEERLVKGCQSRLYLHTWASGDQFFFETEADALISSGLAMTLVLLYSGLTAQEILTFKPEILKELGIVQSISPSRSNGLASLEIKLKQDVITHISKKSLHR